MEETVNICDYEYSSYTWPEFDIANHFWEHCGFECELSRFPSFEQQSEFLFHYLSALYKGSKYEQIFHTEKGQRIIQKWISKIQLLVNLSHLFWGIWGFFQAINSDVKFPYFKYAETRIMLMIYSLPLPSDHQLCQDPLVSLS